MNAPTSAASTSPTPAAPPATCGDLLSDLGESQLAADGWYAVDKANREWDFPHRSRFERDGLLCRWTHDFDPATADYPPQLMYGALPMDEATWRQAGSELAKQGFVSSPSIPIDGFLSGPNADGSWPSDWGMIWRDGMLYFTDTWSYLPLFSAFEDLGAAAELTVGSDEASVVGFCTSYSSADTGADHLALGLRGGGYTIDLSLDTTIETSDEYFRPSGGHWWNASVSYHQDGITKVVSPTAAEQVTAYTVTAEGGRISVSDVTVVDGEQGTDLDEQANWSIDWTC